MKLSSYKLGGVVLAAFIFGLSASASYGAAGELVSGIFTSEAGKGTQPDVEAIQRGREIAADLGWPQPLFDGGKRDQGFVNLTTEHVFAGVYGRDGLTVKEREIAIIATIITQGSVDGLQPHFTTVAPRIGMSEREVREIIYTSCFYAGWPKCANATYYFDKILETDPPSWPQAMRIRRAQ